MDNISKNKRKRSFQKAWLSNVRFKFWIQAVPSNENIYHCIYCKRDISCNTFPSKHANLLSHKNNMDATESSPIINDGSACNNDNKNNGTKTGKKLKKYKFQQKWLEKIEFKFWLREVVNYENLFSCLFCNKTMTGGLSRIQDHARSEKHIKNCENNKEINEDNETNNSAGKPVLSFDKRKKIAEIRYASFIVEKNVPFTVANETLKFFQQLEEHDPNILKNMTSNAIKCKKIITNVLAPVAIDRVVKIIEKTRFSVSIDETTDISKQKWMAFVVRYVDPLTLDTCSQLIKLIDIDAKTCCAKNLFGSFNSEMDRLGISFSNIIALSCDNASIMLGNQNSFKKKLENKCKNLLTINCPCHSSALIAQAACLKIPVKCDIFVKKIASFIRNSPKNTALYKDCFNNIQKPSKKILKLANTRWLSRYKSIENIVASWEAIKRFLTNISKNEKSQTGKYLLELMQWNHLKAYLLFLKYTLNFFHIFNTIFQSTETKIHLLQSESLMLLNTVCKHFLKPELIEKIDDNFQFSLINHQKPLSEVNLGSECEKYLCELINEGHDDAVVNIRQYCLQFYICVAQETYKRLPINNQFLAKLQIFRPEVALCETGREKSYNDLHFIAETLTGFDQNILKNEWLTLPEKFTLMEKNQLASLNFDQMWINIFHQSDSFPNLKLILNAVRSLPNSNADSERVFSFLPDIKTKKRNKLSNTIVDAICVIKSALKTEKKTASTMMITDTHLSFMSSENFHSSFPKKKSNNLKLNDTNEQINI